MGTSTLVHRYTCIQVHASVYRCTVIPMYCYTRITLYRCPDVLEYRCTCAPVYLCTSVLVYRCSSVPVYQCIGVPVYHESKPKEVHAQNVCRYLLGGGGGIQRTIVF